MSNHEIPDPVFALCFKSFPERPVINVAETPWTPEELVALVDLWMDLLARAAEAQ